ncbi:MAG: hypothetical protein R2697_04740 [Ilumatobacteraceae bacterium]
MKWTTAPAASAAPTAVGPPDMRVTQWAAAATQHAAARLKTAITNQNPSNPPTRRAISNTNGSSGPLLWIEFS